MIIVSFEQYLDQGDCTEGDIRLMDGFIEQEGRVEVCVNGVWGSICGKGWDNTDAHVTCQQLGYPAIGNIPFACPYLICIHTEPMSYNNSVFGAGDYPIVYSNVKCGGWEDSIAQCNKDSYLDITCSRDNVVAVLCGDGNIVVISEVRIV